MFLPAAVTRTFPENWPTALAALSFDGQAVQLSPEDTQMLGSLNGFVQRAMGPVQSIGLSDGMYAAIEDALTALPDGAMPRLGYCSWKGSSLVHRPARTLADVMQIITQNDERIGRALACALIAGQGVVLHLRTWVEIAPASEFRAFVRGGRLIGVSQYHHRTRFPELIAQRAEIETALTAFTPTLLAALQTDDGALDPVVVDLWAPRFGEDPVVGVGRHQPDLRVIELNPFDRVTDPCLFQWTGGMAESRGHAVHGDLGGDFDGTLRLA